MRSNITGPAPVEPVKKEQEPKPAPVKAAESKEVTK